VLVVVSICAIVVGLLWVTIVFLFNLFSLSDKVSGWVKDVAKHDTNEINLKERLHATKCDQKDDPQVRVTGWCEMC